LITMNRITQYFDDGSHPLDTPEMQSRQNVLRLLCLAMIGGLIILSVGVVCTVMFALGGRPLSGNAGRLVGVPIVTVLGATLTLSAVAIARAIVPMLWNSGLKRVATEPPETPEDGVPPETDPERLWRVYAGGKFAEFAVTEAAAFATAVLYHLTADPAMIAFVAGIVAFQLLRLPNAARNRIWFDGAALKLEELRSNPAP